MVVMAQHVESDLDHGAGSDEFVTHGEELAVGAHRRGHDRALLNLLPRVRLVHVHVERQTDEGAVAGPVPGVRRAGARHGRVLSLAAHQLPGRL